MTCSHKTDVKAENDELNPKMNIEGNKNVNLRYECMQKSNEIMKQAEKNTEYVKKPKTNKNREFSVNKQKKEIKLLDKKFENYEAKQNLQGKSYLKLKKQLKDSNSDVTNEKSDKRIYKVNNDYDNQEENEYIKLYSKIKSDEKLKKVLNNNKTKSKSNKAEKRKKTYSFSDSESESSENSRKKTSSCYSSYSSSVNNRLRKKDKKSKSKYKLHERKKKSKNSRERDEIAIDADDSKENYLNEKNKNQSKGKRKNQYKNKFNINKKDNTHTNSKKDYFMDRESKNKIRVHKTYEKPAEEIKNKFKKSLSEEIKNMKTSFDESISFEEYLEDKKPINNKEDKTNLGQHISDDKYRTPVIEKKEKYTYRNNGKIANIIFFI